MKKLLGLMLVGIVTVGYGQDTTKIKSAQPLSEGAKVPGAKAAPSFLFKRPEDANVTPKITGQYIIEKYVVQVNSSDAKKAMKVVGNALKIDELIILGDEMDTINYEIYESQFMNTEDVLFRIFGEAPDVIPDDFPGNVMVHKTDNLDCYGIAEISNDLVLIPYNGLLLYLRKY